MSIKIGNQTVFYSPFEPFRFALRGGFGAFEWFPDRPSPDTGWDVGEIDGATRRIIRNKAVEHDMALSVHARLPGNPLKPDSLEAIYEDMEFAADIGASILNIHFYAYEGLEAYAESIRPVIRRLSGFGIRLSIENTPYDSPEDFNRLFGLLRGVSGVGMCIDIGHANLSGSTLNDYMGFVKRLRDVPVIHAHLHENYGDRDSHLALFTGPSVKDSGGIRAFIEYLKRTGFEGSVILEQWPDPPGLLIDARDRLLELMKDGAKIVLQ